MSQRYFGSSQVDILYTQVGIPFTIQLESNPSTGYNWNISSLPAFIRLTNEEYVPNLYPPGYVGGGGTQVFTFVADYAGDGVLSFSYSRPWESGAPAERYAIRIIASY